MFGQHGEGCELLLHWSANSPRHSSDKGAVTKLKQLYGSSNGSYGLPSLLKWIREDQVVPELVLSASRMSTGEMPARTAPPDSVNRPVKSDWTAELRLQSVAFQQALQSKKTLPQYFDGKVIKAVELAFRKRWPGGPPLYGRGGLKDDENDNESASDLASSSSSDDGDNGHDDDDIEEERGDKNNWEKWHREKMQAESFIEEYISIFNKKVTGEAGKPEVFSFRWELPVKSDDGGAAESDFDVNFMHTSFVRRTYENVIQACSAWG